MERCRRPPHVSGGGWLLTLSLYDNVMVINVQNLMNSAFGLRLGLVLGRLLIPHLGYALADSVAAGLASRSDAPDVRAVRTNQQMLEYGRLSSTELEQRTRLVFQNAARGHYELFRSQHSVKAMLSQVELDSATLEYIRLTQAAERGIVFVAPHTGNFDLAGRVLGHLGLNVQVLAEPTPRSDYQMQNEQRRRTGMNIIPISYESLRTAAHHLKNGGSVLTGADWPVPGARLRPVFCGRPSLMPTSHIRMALQACAPVAVIACHRLAQGKYQLASSDLITMQPAANPTESILLNTQSVLAVVEQHIRQDPAHWLMFHQVWEDHEER